jgi:hypothetical protein
MCDVGFAAKNSSYLSFHKTITTPHHALMRINSKERVTCRIDATVVGGWRELYSCAPTAVFG